jgi:hypothetical protein
VWLDQNLKREPLADIPPASVAYHPGTPSPPFRLLLDERCLSIIAHSQARRTCCDLYDVPTLPELWGPHGAFQGISLKPFKYPSRGLQSVAIAPLLSNLPFICAQPHDGKAIVKQGVSVPSDLAVPLAVTAWDSTSHRLDKQARHKGLRHSLQGRDETWVDRGLHSFFFAESTISLVVTETAYI